jgi:hypothetical protein
MKSAQDYTLTPSKEEVFVGKAVGSKGQTSLSEQFEAIHGKLNPAYKLYIDGTRGNEPRRNEWQQFLYNFFFMFRRGPR